MLVKISFTVKYGRPNRNAENEYLLISFNLSMFANSCKSDVEKAKFAEKYTK